MIKLLLGEILSLSGVIVSMILARWLLELSTPQDDWRALKHLWTGGKETLREVCGNLGLSLYDLSWGGQIDPRVTWLRRQMQDLEVRTDVEREAAEDATNSDNQPA